MAKGMSGRTAAQVSRHMASIRKRDTGPERVVREVASSLGYKYRLYRSDLPGTPDLVFPGRRKVILVHGCFWHRHDCPAGRKSPSVNVAYWGPKLARNAARDALARQRLEEMGWRVLVIWECETRDRQQLASRLRSFLE
jgi:DNA mismatch endonuclease, patch repair protein